MLVFVILRRMSAAVCIVGEYILFGIRLSTTAIEFKMISRDIGKCQKLGHKSPKNGHKHESVTIIHVDYTLSQQLSPVRADYGSSMRPMLLNISLTRNDANRLRRPSIEALRVLNEVANCFLEVQNANTVFRAWGMKLIVGQKH